MRSFILGIMILVAVPAYALGQPRDRSERAATDRTATERTAVPREEGIRAVPARPDGRPDPRPGRATASTRGEEEPTRSGAARERRGTPNAARTSRPRDVPQQGNPWLVLLPGHERRTLPSAARTGRLRDEPQQGNPWLVLLPGHGHAVSDRERRRSGQRGGGGANVVFVPYAVPVLEREVVVQREVAHEAALPVVVEQPSSARLILDVHPPTAQVFADGYYIGIPEDFRFEDGGAVLEPGPHRIDIVAPDHAPVSFEVNLARGGAATFRHSLTPITRPLQPQSDAEAKAPAPKPPVTFYLIPGCYMGNVPPQDANLPATCDIARAVSLQY